MAARGMPYALQTKVKRYLQFQYNSRKMTHRGTDLEACVSPCLREEIAESPRQKSLKNGSKT